MPVKRKSNQKSGGIPMYGKVGILTIGGILLYGLFNKIKAEGLPNRGKPYTPAQKAQQLEVYKAQVIAQQNSYANPTLSNINVGKNLASGAVSMGTAGIVLGPAGIIGGAAIGFTMGMYKSISKSKENDKYMRTSVFVKRIPDGWHKCGEIVLRGPDGVEYRLDRKAFNDHQSMRSRMNHSFLNYDTYNHALNTPIPPCTENFPTPFEDALPPVPRSAFATIPQRGYPQHRAPRTSKA